MMRYMWVFWIAFCLVTLMQQARAWAADKQDPLTWAPPIQVHPTKISIEYGSNPTIVQIIRDAYPYDHSEMVEQPITQLIELKFAEQEDAIIQLPRDKKLVTPGISVGYGQNIRMIGGYLIGMSPADKNLRALLRFAGTSGSVFVEGLVLDANNQYGLDGLDVGSVRHKPGIIADIYVQNCLIKGIYSTREGLHADGYQYYGNTLWTRMDHVSISSAYQGLFLDPQNEIRGIDLRYVDVSYPDTSKGNGYAFFLRVEKDRPRHPPVHLENVYVGERTNVQPWEDYSIYPPSSRMNGAVMKGNRACFPAYPEVDGCVNKGAPLSGPYVTEQSAGLNYKSPGYLK